MATPSATPGKNRPGSEHCLARSLADTLAEEPALEAVTIDRARQKISVATLGRTDVDQLTGRLSRKLAAAQSTHAQSQCSLLAGKEECATCRHPLTEEERRRITIHSEGNSTTIARVTCPTAPVFWRWRDLPLPRLEPRTLEIEEGPDEHEHEWKWQLVAAAACGLCGLLAALAPGQLKLGGFVAAYFAGSLFPAFEVWERLRKRVLDIHFLMLAVAVGAACIGAGAKAPCCCFCFRCPARWNITRWAAPGRRFIPCSAKHPRRRPCLGPAAWRWRWRWKKCTGTRLLVKPGSQFPVDAEIVKGGTAPTNST